MEDKPIKALIILEMLGKPKDFVVESLNKTIEKLSEEKDVQLISKDVKEAKEHTQNKEFFTTFAELEVEVTQISTLAMLMFIYMPAHIEVISPEKIMVTNNSYSELLSELTRRLHRYDEIARVLQLELAKAQKKINSYEKPSE